MFLAGDTPETARSSPSSDELARQEQDGCYWWAGLTWWIRCDTCDVITPYHMPGNLNHTEQRLRWEYAWISWTAKGAGQHECARCRTAAIPGQLTIDQEA
jgi:hypothetical protein